MKIAQVLVTQAWGNINPEAIERGLGGRETAMIRLAEQWAKLGHEVTNFVPIERAERHNEGGLTHSGITVGAVGFHEYVPVQLAKPMLACFPYDAVVSWETPSVYADERIVEQQKVRLVHMQVAHFLGGQMEAAEQYATGVVALSNWAKDFLLHSGLEMPEEKLYVRPNGVNIGNYQYDLVQAKATKGHRGAPRFVYSSSPDRGLWNLLKAWPRLKSHWKDAELYVGYGVGNWTSQVRWSHNRAGEMAVEIERLMTQDGVYDMGSIGQKQLSSLQTRCNFWLYPCDPIQPTETGCITAVENLAAGNPSVITDADCLADEFGEVASVAELPFDSGDAFLLALQDLYDNESLYKERVTAGREFAEQRDWKVIAPTWLELFEENRTN